MRILGIDYGSKRIGVAVGETQTRLAFPRKAIRASGSIHQDAERVAALARAEECERVVLGLPLLPSGEEGEQSALVRQLGSVLSAWGLMVDYQDERWTTLAAEFSLSYLKPKKRQEYLDSESARLILQEYLSRLDGEKA
ncbi:MAG: Holliday junction resolvase RuvX [Fimbriimonadales bacterium]|nr:Holliday junction resolvase RuvX [Fimbriimonadales bacterium]